MNKNRIIGAALCVALFARAVEVSQAGAFRAPSSTKALRIAFIGFPGASTAGYETAMRASLATDERAVFIDPSQIQPALKGIGYQGSINLSVEEAQGIGAAIGCDFFIVGKAESSRRSERAKESHEETFIAVMIVESRSGKLALFDFILKRAATLEASQQGALKALAANTPLYLQKLFEFRAARESFVALGRVTAEDLPDTQSALAAGFKPPEFFNRVKPEYTDEAARADITATVEANVVFQADGEVGEIEIIRWAGFGLDESAARTIRQLKFKPATRNNQALNARALIRYNFRRVIENEMKQKPKEAEPKVEEKPQRDLRQLFKPRYRIPPKPNH
jgi:TonB family protein